MREISRTPKRGLGGLRAGGKGGVGRVEATNTTCRGRRGLDSTSGSELSLTIASLRKKGGRCAPRRVVDQLRGLAAIRCFVGLLQLPACLPGNLGTSGPAGSRRWERTGKEAEQDQDQRHGTFWILWVHTTGAIFTSFRLHLKHI